MQLELSDRDEAILEALRQHRLLTAGQIERLCFDGRHASPMATRRRTQAVLRRLHQRQLIARLERRQGGVRAGSAGFTYWLTTRGHRAIGVGGKRARWQPSERLVDHLLATSELSVQLHQAARRGQIGDLQVTHEPDSWRRFVGAHGSVVVLKPDLLVELTTDGWELRWFVEIDRATEHLPTIIGKCAAYERYWRSGHETTIHPVFPRVLWSVPDPPRANAIKAAIDRTSDLTGDLFRVATTPQTLQLLQGGGPQLATTNPSKGGEL
jgi:hypothetical protein